MKKHEGFKYYTCKKCGAIKRIYINKIPKSMKCAECRRREELLKRTKEYQKKLHWIDDMIARDKEIHKVIEKFYTE